MLNGIPYGNRKNVLNAQERIVIGFHSEAAGQQYKQRFHCYVQYMFTMH